MRYTANELAALYQVAAYGCAHAAGAASVTGPARLALELANAAEDLLDVAQVISQTSTLVFDQWVCWPALKRLGAM